jgi:hypothetical protein
LETEVSDLEVIKILLEELEGQSSHVRVTRGYGVGHPHFETTPVTHKLGKSDYEEEPEEKDEESFKPVKVSRVFQK